MSRTTTPVCDRDANLVFCNTKRAIDIASKIAGYDVAPSTLQDAAKKKRVDAINVSHKLWFVIKSLEKYASDLKKKNNAESINCAKAFLRDFNYLPEPAKNVVMSMIKTYKGAK